jgi:hypothetical protein
LKGLSNLSFRALGDRYYNHILSLLVACLGRHAGIHTAGSQLHNQNYACTVVSYLRRSVRFSMKHIQWNYSKTILRYPIVFRQIYNRTLKHIF